jgi:hypothetical protein
MRSRDERRRTLRRVSAAAAMLAALSSCSILGGGSGSDQTRGCHLSSEAVPSCGVLWGISTQPRTMGHLESLEHELGRRFDLVYHYVDVNGTFPDHVERAEVAGGRLLHIAIASRDYDSNRPVTWADVANGKYDQALTAQAHGVASLHVPVFVTFAQEANARDKLGVDGSAADFKAAWRHLHEVYQQAGATNAVWTWVMTGAGRNLDRAASLWPGNDVVDWISWNVYNMAGCGQGVEDPNEFVSFEDRMRIFYRFVHRRGPSFGIDPSKPMMISEAGSVKFAVQSDLAADWYAAIPSALRKYPQIKAVTLWDSTTASCDFKFHATPETVAGVRRAGLDPALDNRGAVSRSVRSGS